MHARDQPPGVDQPVQPFLRCVTTDSGDYLRLQVGGLLRAMGQGVGDDGHIGQIAPIPHILPGQDDKTVVSLHVPQIFPAHQPVRQTPQALPAVLQPLEPREMDFQHLGAAVVDAGEESDFVAEHGDRHVRAERFQQPGKPAAMAELFPRILQQFVGQALPVVLLIMDPEIDPPDLVVKGEGVGPPVLIRRDDGHFMPVGGQPVGLVGQDPFHPGGAVGAGYAVDYYHLIGKSIVPPVSRRVSRGRSAVCPQGCRRGRSAARLPASPKVPLRGRKPDTGCPSGPGNPV